MPKPPPVLTPVSSNQEISKQTEHGLAVCVHTRDAGTQRFTCSTNIYGVVLPAAGEAAVRQTDRQTDRWASLRAFPCVWGDRKFTSDDDQGCEYVPQRKDARLCVWWWGGDNPLVIPQFQMHNWSRHTQELGASPRCKDWSLQV